MSQIGALGPVPAGDGRRCPGDGRRGPGDCPQATLSDWRSCESGMSEWSPCISLHTRAHYTRTRAVLQSLALTPRLCVEDADFPRGEVCAGVFSQPVSHLAEAAANKTLWMV